MALRPHVAQNAASAERSRQADVCTFIGAAGCSIVPRRAPQGAHRGLLGRRREGVQREADVVPGDQHSFVTRNLEAGASLDKVSAAVGHSSPVATKRFYEHHVRKSFSGILTARLRAK
jgi:integrase